MSERKADNVGGGGGAEPVAAEVIGRSPLALGWRRFRANRAALVGMGVLAVVTLACLITGAATKPGAPVSKEEERAVGQPHPWPPTWRHPFGTDKEGRDLALRTLQGGAVSLLVGFAAAAISVVLGTFYGAISGQAGGKVDRWMMRVVDTLYGLPYIVLVILLLVYAQRQFWVLIVAIGCVTWLTMARIVRGEVLRIREQEYVVAARALGATPARILIWHILPNLAGPIIVCATLTVPVAILQESFLSFLGLGVSEPQTSWGTLASDAIGTINPLRFDWWLLGFPCLFLGLTLLCLNFVGDGLRDAFDPRLVTGGGK